jgi:hypothetical protein
MSLFKNIATTVKRTAKIKSPELKIAAAFGFGIAGIVLTVKATEKMVPAKEGFHEEVKEIRDDFELKEDEKAKEVLAPEDYKDYKTEMLVAGKNIFVKGFVNYAPAITLFVGSGLCVLSGFKEIKGRYIGAMALAGQFQDVLLKYRKRVANAVGSDKERDLYHGVTHKDINMVDEDGNVKKVKKAPVMEETENYGRPLTFEFKPYDPATKTGSRICKKGRNDLSMMNLKAAVNNANIALRNKPGKFMTVYEFITDYLGMDPEALVLDNPMLTLSWGWKYTYDNSDETSDNFIDIDVWDANWAIKNPQAEDYLDNYTNHILLQLNAVPLFAIDDRKENKLSDRFDRFLDQR